MSDSIIPTDILAGDGLSKGLTGFNEILQKVINWGTPKLLPVFVTIFSITILFLIIKWGWKKSVVEYEFKRN